MNNRKDYSIWNVAYDNSKGETFLYLAMPCSYQMAEKAMEYFKERYEDKPYPNGKGYYDCRNIRIIELFKEI